MQIAVDKRERGTPIIHTYKVELPCVPREGEYLSHDKLNFSGTVKRVTYWWDEDGHLHPTVEII